VYRAVKRIVEEERFALIETLAETIATHIGQHFAPASVRVCVRKPHAPLKGVLDHVAVEIERTPDIWQ
jgi:dihydroneopterin aldolase